MTSTSDKTDPATEARRRFLASCGRFAAATPPAIALMLADAERSPAFAQSGMAESGGGNNGFGNGGFDGTPGSSGLNPSPNSGEKAADEVR